MENNDRYESASEVKKLLALNNSLEQRLKEYQQTMYSRDEEIEILHSMLASSGANQSKTDNDLVELKGLKQNIERLQKQVVDSSPSVLKNAYPTSDVVSTAKQVDDLQYRYAFMQTQLTELQDAFTLLSSRNILLQQQNSRIAELESLLQNALDEIDALKTRK